MNIGRDAVADQAVETARGPRPKKAFSLPNIVIYTTLTLLAAYYLAPLYVMVVTSLKTMPEVRLGNVFSLPTRDHNRTLDQGLGNRLYRVEL